MFLGGKECAIKDALILIAFISAWTIVAIVKPRPKIRARRLFNTFRNEVYYVHYN
jgi:hypothetical protein